MKLPFAHLYMCKMFSPKYKYVENINVPFAQGSGSACLFRWAATTRRQRGEAGVKRSVLNGKRNQY